MRDEEETIEQTEDKNKIKNISVTRVKAATSFPSFLLVLGITFPQRLMIFLAVI